jgi:hypothetical protein
VGTAASAVPPEPALSERSESKGRSSAERSKSFNQATEQPKRFFCADRALFLLGLRRNLLDHNRGGPAARVPLATGRDSLSGKG